MPKPGEGPTKKQRKDLFLRLHAIGTGVHGSEVKATLYFPNDPGYVDTARMLIETGLCLSLEKEVKKISGGYHTTASSCG